MSPSGVGAWPWGGGCVLQCPRARADDGKAVVGGSLDKPRQQTQRPVPALWPLDRCRGRGGHGAPVAASPPVDGGSVPLGGRELGGICMTPGAWLGCHISGDTASIPLVFVLGD